MPICTTTLPQADADLCNFRIKFGRIDAIMYTRAETTDAVSDASSATVWAARLSNTTALTASGTAAPIRYHYVRGEWPLPEATDVEVSAGRRASTTPTSTITLTVDDVGAINSALLQAKMGKTERRRVWLAADGEVHGGNDGYLMDMTYLGKVIPGAKAELQSIQIRLVYEGVQVAPVTVALPIF
ncbi:MAG: hypothetical protein ACRCYO_19185 [Bacteroidia bacterium]